MAGKANAVAVMAARAENSNPKTMRGSLCTQINSTKKRSLASLLEEDLASVLLLLRSAAVVAEKDSPANEGDSSEMLEWNVRSVMAGDGSVGRCGLCVQDGAVYASAAMDGGIETFWEVAPGSLRVCDQGADILVWPMRAVTPRARAMFANALLPSVDLRGLDMAKKRLKLIVELMKWVKEHPGVAVLIGGPGDREPSPLLRQHMLPDSGRVFQSSSRRCVEGSLVNGVSRLFGTDAAKKYALVLLRMGCGVRVSVVGLKRLCKMIQECNRESPNKVEVRKMSPRDRTLYEKNAFTWLAEDARGLWIVRLVDHLRADHCVLVDTKEALIFDPACEYPIALTESALRLCGGQDATKLKVEEVRELVAQKKKDTQKKQRLH